MTQSEKQEILSLPPKYRPLSAWAFWGYGLLFSVPIVGFIFLIIFSFKGNNVCRRSYARSYFCMLIIILVIFAVVAVVAGTAGVAELFSQLLK